MPNQHPFRQFGTSDGCPIEFLRLEPEPIHEFDRILGLGNSVQGVNQLYVLLSDRLAPTRRFGVTCGERHTLVLYWEPDPTAEAYKVRLALLLSTVIGLVVGGTTRNPSLGVETSTALYTVVLGSAALRAFSKSS